MGARESVAKEPPLQQRGEEPTVRIVVVGCSNGTRADHLINKFVFDDYRVTYPSNMIPCVIMIKRRFINEKKVALKIFNETVSLRLNKELPHWHMWDSNIGLMILYDVRDGQSFEDAKEVLTLQLQVCRHI